MNTETGNETYPALNIMGGKRYIKNRSSLKTKRCELFPSLMSKITTPVHIPCEQDKIKLLKYHNSQKNIKTIGYIIHFKIYMSP